MKRIYWLFILLITGFLISCEPFFTSTTSTKGISNKELKVYFMDVDQGDAALISYDNHYILIDGGENDKGEFLVEYLRQLGVQRLDYCIGTHPDSDHIGGLDVVINSLVVDNIIDSGFVSNTSTYNDYHNAIGNEINDGSGTFILDSDMKISIDENVYLKIFETGDNYSDNNNNSVVLQLTYNEVSFFFAADMATLAEDYLVKRVNTEGLNIKSTLLKSAHHGSKTSSGKAILDLIDPEYVVISAGVDNSYGLPTMEALYRYSLFTDNIYITYESCPALNDYCSIIATTLGKTISINSEPIVIPEYDKSANMEFLNIDESIALGDTITISVNGEPNTLYDIDIVLPSGSTSSSSKLADKVTPSSGIVSWDFTFSRSLSIGTGCIIVKNKVTGELIKYYYQLIK